MSRLYALKVVLAPLPGHWMQDAFNRAGNRGIAPDKRDETIPSGDLIVRF